MWTPEKEGETEGLILQTNALVYMGSVRVVGELLPSVAAHLGHICSDITAERFSEKEGETEGLILQTNALAYMGSVKRFE